MRYCPGSPRRTSPRSVRSSADMGRCRLRLRRDPDRPARDDTCDPPLMTSARLARQLLQCATDAAELATRIQGCAAYVDHAPLANVADDLHAYGIEIGRIRGEILTGKVSIVAGRDEAAGRERYPLIERPAATESNGHAEPEPSISPLGEPSDSWRSC